MSRLPNEIAKNLTLPVIAAPMFLVSGPDLVIAACEAGIIGSFPATNARSVSMLDEWMHTITSALDTDDNSKKNAIWSVNLLTHRSYARLDDELDLIRRYRPALVTTSLGNPSRVIKVVHAYGGFVFADVNSIAFARRAADSGVDGLVLVSSGAGGHTGQITPFAFVPSVREFWDGPLVVGGGISDGRTIRALEVLGGDLAYMGTRFIASQQSLASDRYRQMIVDADADDLIATSAFTGVTANMLKPSIVRAGLNPDDLTPRTTIDFRDPHGIKKAKPWKDIWSAGQGVGCIHDIESVASIVARLKEAYVAAIEECRTEISWPGLET